MVLFSRDGNQIYTGSHDGAVKVWDVSWQESTNILRHSAATEAEMEVAVQGEDFLLTITDNGRGLSLGNDGLPHHGLAGMRHRINTLGGQCEIARREEGGTRVRVSIPLANILRSASADAEIPDSAGVRSPPELGSQAGTSTGG